MSAIVPDYQTGQRMALKEKAIPWPKVAGKRVLDCGTDFAHWAFRAAREGAADVLGLDRNRKVRKVGLVDLIEMNRARAAEMGFSQCRFERINMGKDWREFGVFDVVLVMSVYHHMFESAGGDHAPVWFWLSRHCVPGSVVIWEGPVDDTDCVVRANVSDHNRPGYTRDAILSAARLYFDGEFIGPALHEPTREVWRFVRRGEEPAFTYRARVISGAGGAAPAFRYAGGRRQKEIQAALGFEPVPGSLNLQADRPFDWDRGYVRAEISDVAVRGKGLDTDWALRWCRFYPVVVDGIPAWAMKFEGDTYRPNFVELIAPERLRDHLKSNDVTLTQ